MEPDSFCGLDPDNLLTDDTDAWLCPDITDHSYLNNSNVDRLVHSTHNYYQRLGPNELEDNITEHGYACQLPKNGGFTSFIDYDEEDDPFVNGLVFDTYHCQWADCNYKTESVEKLDDHVDTHLDIIKFVCSWRGCKKKNHVYARRYLLARHVRSHTGYKPFYCDQCGRYFATSERCRLHIRTVHDCEVKYRCEYCHRFFKTTSDRCHHISRVHLKNRLTCQHCGNSFAGRCVLTKHMTRCKVRKSMEENF